MSEMHLATRAQRLGAIIALASMPCIIIQFERLTAGKKKRGRPHMS